MRAEENPYKKKKKASKPIPIEIANKDKLEKYECLLFNWRSFKK